MLLSYVTDIQTSEYNKKCNIISRRLNTNINFSRVFKKCHEHVPYFFEGLKVMELFLKLFVRYIYKKTESFVKSYANKCEIIRRYFCPNYLHSFITIQY